MNSLSTASINYIVNRFAIKERGMLLRAPNNYETSVKLYRFGLSYCWLIVGFYNTISKNRKVMSTSLWFTCLQLASSNQGGRTMISLIPILCSQNIAFRLGCDLCGFGSVNQILYSFKSQLLLGWAIYLHAVSPSLAYA